MKQQMAMNRRPNCPDRPVHSTQTLEKTMTTARTRCWLEISAVVVAWPAHRVDKTRRRTPSRNGSSTALCVRQWPAACCPSAGRDPGARQTAIACGRATAGAMSVERKF